MNKKHICFRLNYGFTLLEVLVALALSVAIVGALSTAVHLHLVNLQKQSTKIEYKQVARSVLMMIGNDVRNAVQYKPIDYTVLEELVASQAAQLGQAVEAAEGANGTGTGTGTGTGAGAGTEGATSTAGQEEEEPEPIATPEEEVTGRPTLVGTSNLLSLDVSRIPRVDEYNTLTQSDATLQLPADIKTVVYFIDESNNSNNQLKFNAVSNAASGGLYRRQIDRAIAAYAEEDGINNSLDQYAELIAPEIAQIAFRYFDGEDWQESWDSLESGGFPPAIEIIIVIDPARLNAGSDYTYGGFDQETMQQFRLVVSLPTGEPAATGNE